MGGILIGVAAAAIGLAKIVGHVSTNRRYQRRLAEFVKARGGRIQRASFNHRARTDFVVDQVIVRLAMTRQRSRSFAPMTHARAVFAYGVGPRFELKRRGAKLSLFTKQRDAKRVGLDDLPFDDAYVLTCDDLAATRHALTQRARKLALLSGVHVHSNGREVTVDVDGEVETEQNLERLIALAAELASFGAHDVASYASLPGVSLHPPTLEPSAPFRCVLENKAGEVELGPTIGCGVPGLSLRLLHARQLPAFKVMLGGAKPAGMPGELLTDELAPRFVALPDATLANQASGDENVLMIEWQVPRENAVLMRGVELLTAIAAPTQTTGAFR